jgi:S-adenosylhomocysteine hydrolase
MHSHYPSSGSGSADLSCEGIAEAASDRLLGPASPDLRMLRCLRERYRAQAPLRGARIAILCPVNIYFAAFIALLLTLGARVRCAATDGEELDGASVASLQAAGVSVLAYEGREPTGDCDDVRSILAWPDSGTADLIVDYDGRIACLVHRGVAIEAGLLPHGIDADGPAIDRWPRQWSATNNFSCSAVATNVIGLSECTASGAASLRNIERTEGLLFPAIDVSLRRTPGPPLDRDHLAAETLVGLLIRLALAQIELFTNGASYRPRLHGFPARLIAAERDLERYGEAPANSRPSFVNQ